MKFLSRVEMTSHHSISATGPGKYTAQAYGSLNEFARGYTRESTWGLVNTPVPMLSVGYAVCGSCTNRCHSLRGVTGSCNTPVRHNREFLTRILAAVQVDKTAPINTPPLLPGRYPPESPKTPSPWHGYSSMAADNSVRASSSVPSGIQLPRPRWQWARSGRMPSSEARASAA